LATLSQVVLSVMRGINGRCRFNRSEFKCDLKLSSEFKFGRLARKVEESPLKDALKLRPPPAKSKTPPYVTSQPQITHQKLPLSQYGEAVQGSDVQKRHSRFIVLATDGLWDELSSEEVVSLVGEHLNGTRGVVSKDKFSIATADSVQQIHGKAPRSHQQDTGSWHFVDENLATHLIRNAFGSGPDPDKLSRLLSIPAPYSRRFRDDTSITVVVWEADDTPLKAKL
jgi:pyruvate dehydrogenase phosphatase